MADYPEDYKYTKEHEWIAVEGMEAAVKTLIELVQIWAEEK